MRGRKGCHSVPELRASFFVCSLPTQLTLPFQELSTGQEASGPRSRRPERDQAREFNTTRHSKHPLWRFGSKSNPFLQRQYQSSTSQAAEPWRRIPEDPARTARNGYWHAHSAGVEWASRKRGYKGPATRKRLGLLLYSGGAMQLFHQAPPNPPRQRYSGLFRVSVICRHFTFKSLIPTSIKVC